MKCKCGSLNLNVVQERIFKDKDTLRTYRLRVWKCEKCGQFKKQRV